MRKVLLSLTFVLLCITYSYAGVAYLGVDDYGSVWFLDTSVKDYADSSNDIVDFYISTTMTIPYKQEILNLLIEELGNQKAIDIINSMHELSYRCVYDRSNGTFCIGNIFIYSNLGGELYSHFFGLVFNNWGAVSNNKIIQSAVDWIKDNIPEYKRALTLDEAIEKFTRKKADVLSSAENRNVASTHQSAETNSKVIETVALSLLCGILLCVFIVIAVQDFMNKKPPTAVQPYECPDDEVIDAIFVDEPRKEKI